VSEYYFPAQKDCCACCARPLDLRPNGTVVKGRALPWVFCSRECFASYHGKDGADQSESVEGAK
jgi:hypothetical protein